MRKIALLFAMIAFVACQKNENLANQEIIEVLQAKEFSAHIENKDVQLIDVRMKSEFEQGHIKGAKHHHIYDKDFAEQVSYLDKDTPVYVYCKAGSRSEEAALELQKMGFTKIYDLKGGISSWKGEVE